MTHRTHIPCKDKFFATYQRQIGTTEAESATMAAAEERGAVTLDEIRETCVAVDTNAELRDVAGFKRGWVYDDGGYILR